MEPTTIEIFLWYCLRIISCLGVTRLLRYGSLYNLYNQAILGILKLAYLMDKEAQTAEEYKYNAMKGSLEGQELETVRMADERAKEIWRFMIIQTVITLTPIHLRNTLQFKTWDQAVRLIEKHQNGGDNVVH